jgi:hypothetical protein
MNHKMKLLVAETQLRVAQQVAVALFRELHKMRPNIDEWLINFERSLADSFQIVSLDGSPPNKEMLTLLEAGQQSLVECINKIREYLEEEGDEG